MNPAAVLTALRARRARILADAMALVECESPSEDLVATAACAELVADLGAELLGSRPEVCDVDGRRHLIWRSGGPTRVLLLGHLDTVWPLGTTARWPVSVRGETATGPGIFDMKAGLAQMLHAVSVLDDRSGITMLVTSDEEIGSPTSRALIEREAAGVRAALVGEASADGALKTARKGVSLYRLRAHGRAAHAGLEPESGVNATTEIARQVLAVAALGDADAGTSVTPTVLVSGRSANTVPDLAELSIDVRAAGTNEQLRVDRALRALPTTEPGARLELMGGINRPPMEAASARDLFELAGGLAEQLGLPPLRHVAVGGASDGNFTAGVGAPTLDGLGAVGGAAHAEGEWVDVGAMADRSALLAALTAAVCGAP